MTTARKTDRQYNRQQMQRLAMAAGMTLTDGSPIVVGGPLCPATRKIKAAVNFAANRMSQEQFSDARDDYGATRPYYQASFDGSDEVRQIMSDWSGMSDVEGEMTMAEWLQIS